MPTRPFSAALLVTHQTFLSFDQHWPLFLEVFGSPRLDLVPRLWWLRALVLGLLARMIRGEPASASARDWAAGCTLALWQEVFAANPEPTADAPADSAEDLAELCQSILYGGLMMEAMDQRSAGTHRPSDTVSRLTRDPAFKGRRALTYIIETVERCAYQGYVRFAVENLVDEGLRSDWETEASDVAVESLASIRALYQSEVDAIFEGHESLTDLWLRVRAAEGFPSSADLHSIGISLWLMVAIATNIQLGKATGVYLLELGLAKSASDYWKRVVQLTVELLADPERIDIAHVQWGLAHDPDWDRYGKLQIPREILVRRHDTHMHYAEQARLFIERYGKGMFYDRDKAPSSEL